MAALHSRMRTYIFSSCGFFLLFFPRLISAEIGCLPYFHTWCGLSVNLECRSETCCAQLAENTGAKKSQKKSPSGHHATTLSGYIFATKACVDNREKNLLSSSISCRCPHNMVNFGLLAAEICWRVWGTPANFSRFRVLAALLKGTLVVSISQTLRRWTENATYIRQGCHHVGHWPTFLVLFVITLLWSDSQCCVPQESGNGSRKFEACGWFFVVVVIAEIFLECFDTVDRSKERPIETCACVPLIKR